MLFFENNNEKKDIDIKNPYELNEYIKVAKPSIWILLISVSAFIVSLFIWSIFGTIEDKVEAVMFIKDYQSEVFIAKNDYPRVREGMKLRINDHEFEILSISKNPEALKESYFTEDYEIGDFKAHDKVYKIKVAELEDAGFTTGTYLGDIVVKLINPITFFAV